MTEGPNLERRSNAALLCFLIGCGLIGIAHVLGLGGVASIALSGGDPTAVAGGLGALIALALAGVVGAILSAVGAIWIVVQVIVDQTRKDRYNAVDR